MKILSLNQKMINAFEGLDPLEVRKQKGFSTDLMLGAVREDKEKNVPAGLLLGKTEKKDVTIFSVGNGCYIGGEKAVTGLCEHGEEILEMLERIGTVFSIDEKGRPMRRAFGGQSHKRTYYCGASTGKQIVSALVMEARRFEAMGLICRRLWCCFHSVLPRDGVCHGALLYDETQNKLEAVCADAVVMATGGQNALFGKTTGSTQCDGYAAGRLFMQGAVLKNLEFIQYHPTTLETPQKRMLISEAARGEGGRLYYEEDGQRVYFMEEKYGPRGNLMTRDVVAREIHAANRPVLLDISFLGKQVIDERLAELLTDMAETMRAGEGVGLAAPQVGVLKRCCVIDMGEGLIELVNPEITASQGEVTVIEGCLSVPGKPGPNGGEYGPVYFIQYADSSLVMATTVYYTPASPTESVKSDNVLRRRYLHIAAIAFHEMYFYAESPAYCRLVDHVRVTLRTRADPFVRRENVAQTETLRGLGGVRFAPVRKRVYRLAVP